MNLTRKRTFVLILMVLFTLLGAASPASLQAPDASTSTVLSDGTLRRIRVPILMYHYVSPLPQDADEYRIDLTVTPETFRQHMQYLHDEGYQTVSMYQLHRALLTGSALPPQPIILTFDDGYIDHYVNVFPILSEYGFIGTFFIITGKADLGDPNYMTWDEITEMANFGMNMEPHTRDHVDLRGRDTDFLVYQVVGSIESLEAHTGQPTHIFAYPAGRYDSATLAVLDSVPIWRAVTTEYGMYHTSDNWLEVQRLRVSGNMGVAGLAQLLHSDQ